MLMPIQLLLDWSKALVAIVCSLLLAISFIMCTAKPISISRTNDLHENRSQLLKRNAIESENHLIPTSTDTMMPLNITLSQNPFGLNVATKNDTSVVKWHINSTTRTSPLDENLLKKTVSREYISTSKDLTIANHLLNATNELNLDAVNENDQQPHNFKLLDSLAKTKSNSKLVNTTNVSNEENAAKHDTTTNLNIVKSASKKLVRITDDASKSSKISQNIHQSTITTKATIQSVFLDHLNNFNGTKTQHIDSNIHKNNLNASNYDEDMADKEILSRTERSVHLASNKQKKLHNDSSDRIERSANFSLSKATKRIQLLIKGRFLQMLSDGTVNGTQDDESEYTILQRNTVDVGQIRLIGIATCLYLCMDTCGNLYTSREFTNDCIFNERLEDNYNYYTSTHHSSALRTYYMALNRLGVPRKTHLPSNKPLGKLSTYVRAFTLNVPEHRSDAVIGKRFGFNHLKHGIKHLCESGKQLMELTSKQLVYPECNSGGSNSNGNINSSLSKKQPNHHIRHANINHRRLVPASLTEPQRGRNRKQNIKGNNCNTEQCLKKKKMNSNNGNRSNGNQINNKKNVKKLNTKSMKNKLNKRVQVTKTTTTTTTTESTISIDTTDGNSSDNYDDELDYSSGSVHLASNGQTGISSDEDYDGDK